PNCVSLSKEIEVSRRTLVRDFDYMRGELKMPIEFNRSRCGFYYTRDDVEFPGLKVTSGELIALTVARLSIECWNGTSFEPQLRSAFAKLTRELDEEIRFNWKAMDEILSFRGPGMNIAMDPKVFQSVFDALIGMEEIRFTYQKSEDHLPEERHAQPVHLLCSDYAWYLLVHDLVQNDIRTFALSLMSDIQLTGTRFVRPPRAKVLERLEHSVGVYAGTPERVHLRLTKTGARFLRRKPLIKSQQFSTGPDGSTELTADLAITPELEHAFLHWGMHVEVLEPKRLRQAILEHARVIVERG
ncbi:MAG: WYL domain-containing protein, partial [Verrucomicrobiaceae bacterium]